MRIAVISLTIAFCLGIGHADAQNISDDAMRHFDRGQAAVEMAKSTTDYEDAIKEFEKAARLAPDWPDVYYNLGLIQEKVGKDDDAIRNLTKYLELSPNASDSREVKKFVAKMEYKKEKAKAEYDKKIDFIGTWDVSSHLNDNSWRSVWAIKSKDGMLICEDITNTKIFSIQVDGQNLKTPKITNEARWGDVEYEYHLELITKTLMRGYCTQKTVWVSDPHNAHLVGRILRYKMELRKR